MEEKMENEVETGIIGGIIRIRVSKNEGYLFGDPYNKDYSILGSILGFPHFGKVPFEDLQVPLPRYLGGLSAQSLGGPVLLHYWV